MSDSFSTSLKTYDAAALATFALQLQPASLRDPASLAFDRGWVGRDGRPTEEGSRLLGDLAEQSGTRSVFRNIA